MQDDRSTKDVPLITNLKTSDSDEMSAFIRGWDHEYVQLQRGKFPWKIDIIQIGEFQIFELAVGGRAFAKGLIPKDTCAVAVFPDSLPGDGSFLGREITTNTHRSRTRL